MADRGWTEWREMPDGIFVSSVDRPLMRRTLLDRLLGRPGRMSNIISCGARLREHLPTGTAYRALDGSMRKA